MRYPVEAVGGMDHIYGFLYKRKFADVQAEIEGDYKQFHEDF
jgi:hypothetical protein